MGGAKEKGEKACAACKETVVKLDTTLGLVCLILNCIPFTSGIGTMISACAGSDFQCNTLVHGICQFLLTFIIVGWVWSIFQGIWIYKASKGESY